MAALSKMVAPSADAAPVRIAKRSEADACAPALGVVPALRIVIVGHVDHGKSTVVGRLMHDTGSLPEGRFEEIQAMCERRGVAFEWAFLLDSLQAERDQGVTIDTTQIHFRHAGRSYVIIDAPGHREFLKNMVSGAAQADAAVLVVDAKEGMQEQSRRHGYLLHLMGMERPLVLINKMDAVEYARPRFAEVERDCCAYLAELGMTPGRVIPVCARTGENLAVRSEAMSWYEGPALAQALAELTAPPPPLDLPLRFPVQDVYKFDERRIIAGRVESGRLRVGDALMFSPSNKVGRVKTIESWPQPAEPPREAAAGQSIGVTLEDQLFVERGEVASHEADAPVESDVFRGRLFWLGRRDLRTGDVFGLRLGPRRTQVRVQEVARVTDTDTLQARPSDRVERNQVAEVILRASSLLALDEFTRNAATGRFVLVDGYDIAGGGIISMEGYADQRQLVTQRATNITRVEHAVTAADRASRTGHGGGVIWLTGLSGAGKSTLAVALERRLHDAGCQVFALDGDNVRLGLNANLGFSPEDRAENIRRVGETAALFSRAGMLAVTAFISPYRSDRARARAAAGDAFCEVYIKASLDVCERRDPKGLYRRARAGEITDFTGIDAPYEPPEAPDLVIDTSTRTADDCVEELVAFVLDAFRLRADP